MTANGSFAAFHRHGFVRVATCTPRVRPADVAFNRDSLIDQMHSADRARADLLVCPELCLSSYAIDDLHMQEALLNQVEAALARLVEASQTLSPVVLIGAPLRREGRLYNCAVAISRGQVLGVVPKSYLPNYREFYEKRWFAHGRGLSGDIAVAGQRAPFGDDLIFQASDLPGLIFHIEICEDLWTPAPPSADAAMAGALILTNLSASNIVIGKSSDRHLLCQSQSMRAFAAYVYSAAGPGESTTDLSWDGQGMIHELGDLLAESTRFPTEPELTVADVDTARILSERMRTGSFDDASRHKAPAFRRIAFAHHPQPRGRRADPADPPLSLCAEPGKPSGSGLLRGVQYPGRGPAPPVRGDLGQDHGDRHLRRAGFDPCADRRGQGMRPHRPAPRSHPRLHHARLCHVRGHEIQRLAPDARHGRDSG